MEDAKNINQPPSTDTYEGRLGGYSTIPTRHYTAPWTSVLLKQQWYSSISANCSQMFNI